MVESGVNYQGVEGFLRESVGFARAWKQGRVFDNEEDEHLCLE